ncbi:helix-turn-helix transcriptional regulator [Streptococcus dysgalactiae]|uniref:helix-turn-helix transcriptional regulator n=1 Tax=Streptococcus dysgalactiae TaxID=1334 RepID=UPI000E035497|nr:helix-turn-helix transcriptional regulator [Streptococcus dysgalactiae]MDY2963826.1 helix-turn-helix transcriptional regulator [Streptococcus dysgalactiae]MDY4034420.1 helix-turn-helix transcriptional regulator [Streptococcus dysgalactiae]QQT02896.1 helix-turn-helix transcriptional regulator [Streptococcus dysgalactiae]SUN44615.1 Cro-like protein, phage associated [Streptococcus dysgalactiae subsp. dysgalactiae]SUN49082.1 Cro-like protein, phage associated [Streptococcus dysgalactiae]
MTKMTLEMARAKVSMTQEEIARKIGVDRNTYASYENYKTPMRIDKAISFCKVVNVSIDDIIFLNQNYTSSVQR